MKPYTPHDVARFWSKVQVGDPEDCWPWLASTSWGYGQFVFDYHLMNAHRFAYWLHYSKHPGDLQVCHKCDHPLCCNPEHLFLGTQRDNMEDCAKKGHMAKKLTEDDVREIRAKHVSGATQRQLAKDYGVNSFCISAIVHRRTWKHVV